MKKYLEQIYWGNYRIQLFTQKLAETMMAPFIWLIYAMLHLPVFKNSAAKQGKTPKTIMEEVQAIHVSYTYNDSTGTILDSVTFFLWIFYMFVLLDIILIFQLITGLYYVSDFVHQNDGFWIVYIPMAFVTHAFTYLVYLRDKKYTKIIRKFKRKSEKQKRIAMRNFLLSVLIIALTTFILVVYEYDVRVLHKDFGLPFLQE